MLSFYLSDSDVHPSRTAIVLSGGGTRGAYEAGVIHYIRTQLPPKLARELRFHIQSGSSVGAINAAFMAATADDPIRQGTELVQLWRDVRTENIYRRGPITLSKLLLRTFVGIVSHLAGIEGWKKRGDRALHFQGFFDTSPFFSFLRSSCPWQNISRNIDSGLVHAVVVSATNMLSGQSEMFLQKHGSIEHSDRILTRLVKLTPRHVMASAALPLLFPPVPIDGVYYSDGGLRLTTPLAPAVSLGASRILLIGVQYRTTAEQSDTQARARTPHYPTLGEILGKVLHSILLDRLFTDRDQVERINRILAAASDRVDPDTYRQICQTAGVQQIETLSIFPTQDIAGLVDDTVRGSMRNLRSLSSLERFILRVLEADPETGTDLLSYFLFEPTYLRKLIDLGFDDARKSHDALAAFAERSISES